MSKTEMNKSPKNKPSVFDSLTDSRTNINQSMSITDFNEPLKPK